MNSEQLITIYRIAMYISMGVMLLGFGTAVFLFFKFDIRTVRALMTGKIQAKTVEKMMATGDYYLGKEEERAAVSANAENLAEYGTEKIHSGTHNQDMTVALSGSGAGTGSQAQETTILTNEQETTILSNDQETTILNQSQEMTKAYRPDTEVLSTRSEATTGHDIPHATMILKNSQKSALDALGAENMKPYYEETEAVDSAPTSELIGGRTETIERETNIASQNVRFVTIEHTMLIHSDEIIPG